MELILIRHGEPLVEVDIVDPPLTPLGERQALSTADFLASAAIDGIYVSPQQRAQQTMVPLADRHGLDAVTDERIAEWDYGGVYAPAWVFEPMSREEANAKFEAMQGPDFHARVKSGFDDIIAGNPGRKIAVVCHGGVIRSLVQDVLKTTSASMHASHASVSRIVANRRGMRSLISFNEHSWIPTE